MLFLDKTKSVKIIYRTKSTYLSDSNYTRLYLRFLVFSMLSKNWGIHVELSLPETRRSVGYENERHRCGKSAHEYVYTLGMCLSIKLSGIVFSGNGA